MVFFDFGNAESKSPAMDACPRPGRVRLEEFDMKYLETGDSSNSLVALTICAAIVLAFCKSPTLITQPLAGVGRVSLVIMALHVAIIYYTQDHLPFDAIYIAAPLLPALAYLALKQFAVTRVVFLGTKI